MPLSGSLKTLPALDLLEWLGRRHRSGELSLTRGSVAKTFRIESGCVTQASSSDPREYLGQYLVDLGYLSAEELGRVSLVKLESSTLLGQLLTAVGLVGDAEVHDCLQRKIRDAVCDVVVWGDGQFRFEEAVLDGINGDVSLAIPLDELLRESVLRAEVWERIRRAVPDRRARLAAANGAHVAANGAHVPPNGAADGATQRLEALIDAELLAAAAEGRSVEEAIARRRSQEYVILTRLLELERRGELVIQPAAGRGPGRSRP
jgi:hypothetical protein